MAPASSSNDNTRAGAGALSTFHTTVSRRGYANTRASLPLWAMRSTNWSFGRRVDAEGLICVLCAVDRSPLLHAATTSSTNVHSDVREITGGRIAGENDADRN